MPEQYPVLSFTEERGDHLHDILELFIGQLCVNRNRQHFFRGAFGLRERALLVPQVAITILQVQRQGIIHF